MDQIKILILKYFCIYKFLLEHKSGNTLWSFSSVSRAYIQFLSTLPGTKHLGWNFLSEIFTLAWISLEIISKQCMAMFF